MQVGGYRCSKVRSTYRFVSDTDDADAFACEHNGSFFVRFGCAGTVVEITVDL